MARTTQSYASMVTLKGDAFAGFASAGTFLRPPGPCTVPFPASRCRTSPTSRRRTFIRAFRATFGETPHTYLQRRRIERAMFLLRSTEHTVTEICMDIGFASLGTFSRTFHRIVGETPSDYRRRGRVPAAPT